MYLSSISVFFLLQARQTKDPLNPLEMEAGFNMVSGTYSLVHNITTGYKFDVNSTCSTKPVALAAHYFCLRLSKLKV